MMVILENDLARGACVHKWQPTSPLTSRFDELLAVISFTIRERQGFFKIIFFLCVDVVSLECELRAQSHILMFAKIDIHTFSSGRAIRIKSHTSVQSSEFPFTQFENND